jgi:hypothetical protein
MLAGRAVEVETAVDADRDAVLEPDAVAVAEYIHSVLATTGGQGSPPGRNPVGVQLNILVGDAKAGEAYFAKGCASCHSVTGDLKGLAAKYPDPRALQNAWVAGAGASNQVARVRLQTLRSDLAVSISFVVIPLEAALIVFAVLTHSFRPAIAGSLGRKQASPPWRKRLRPVNFGSSRTASFLKIGVKYRDKCGNGLTNDDTPLGGVTIKLYRDVNNNGSLDAGDGAAGRVGEQTSASGLGQGILL